jgi:predicted dehydrogenase
MTAVEPIRPRHRIGIVATGGIAHRHIAGYRAMAAERGEVVAAADPNRETLDAYCDRYEIANRFTDPVAMIASGTVDVISLLTPPVVRAEVIRPAIARGVHMLVEKPFGETYRDAAAFVDAAARANVQIAVNQQLRFMPDVLMARDLIAEGTIGDIRLIAHDQMQNRTRTRGWRKDESRLEISIFSIHLLDRVRWLMGRAPVAVSATTRNWSDAVAGETFATVTIQFEGGGVGTMTSNWHALTLPECRLRIDGTEASFLSVKDAVVSDQATASIHRADGAREDHEFELADAFTTCMGASMRAFLESIDAGVPAPHSGQDNLATMAIVDAAYLSASRGGSRVEIAEITEGALASR